MKKLILLFIVLLTTSFCYAQEISNNESLNRDEILIFETFASYSIGSKIAVAANASGNYWWTTWSNSPGSTEDGVVANYNGNRCGHLTYGNDQVLLLGDEESGIYDLEFEILVPNGKNAYFNILHNFAGSGSTWALESYLHMSGSGTHSPGTGLIHAGGSNAATFTCVYDAWMHFRLHVDTDNDVAEYYYTAPGEEEQMIHTWTWSLNSQGSATVGRKLAAMDFYPPQNANNSEFYLDNFSFKRIGEITAPHFVITPNTINETLNENGFASVSVTLNNTGNSIGDWIGWIDFGEGDGGDLISQLNYDAEPSENSSLVGYNWDSPTIVEVATMFPGAAYAAAAMGTNIISAQYYMVESSSGFGVEENTPLVFRVYSQGLYGQPGEVLAEKVVPYSEINHEDWTIATFDTPVQLTGYNVWIACEFTQTVGGYGIVFDGQSYIPYSGYIRTGGGGAFEPLDSENMSQDYGCIHLRANIQGAPVQNSSWATMSKSFGSLSGGTSETITLTLNSIGLSQGAYNANVIIETNDVYTAHVIIPLTLNVIQNVTNYTITVTANPTNGGSVSGGGSYASGSSCTLHATANSGYSFLKWTKNGTMVSSNPNYSFTVTENASYVAHFQQNVTNYTITLSANPANGGTVTGGGTYQQGSSCTVTATANSGYSFTNWIENGSVVSTNASYTFTLNNNRNLVANFTADPVPTYTITLSANPANGGIVTGGGTYNQGSSRTVTATANSGYSFTNWTENGSVVSSNTSYTFTLNSNRNLVANFTADPVPTYTITVSANPTYGGTVTGGGSFSQGSSRTVTATANSGYSFTNWTENGSVVSSNASYTFTLNSNRNLVANFNPIAHEYTITANPDPAEGGTVMGAGTYEEGAICELTAIPNEGYVFENWTRNGNIISENNPYSFPVNRDLAFIAHFRQDASHFTIIAKAEPIEGGSVSGGGPFESGETCHLNAVAAEGYEFVNWTLNEIEVSTDPYCNFPVTGNATYVAHFRRAVNHYTITVSIDPTGAGSALGAGTYEEGTTCTLIAISNPTYSFVGWMENGVVVSTNDQYSFEVNRNRTLIAVFSQGLFYTISASAGPNGTISPSGDVRVMPGEDQTFAFIPDDGCSVSKVIVDGNDIGAVPSYTFRNVNGDHSIYVQFSGLSVDDHIAPNLKIYPNPAQEKINIESPNMKHIAVFNLLGVQIESKEVNDDYATIGTARLSSGTYILKVEYLDKSVGYSRFVVAK